MKLTLRLLLTPLSVLALAGSTLLSYPALAATTQSFGLFQSSNNLSYTIGSSSYYHGAIQYYGWNEGLQSSDIKSLPTSVKPYLELQTCGNPCNSQNSVALASVVAGDSDSYLTSYAASIASTGRKVYVTFDHEMNGSWYPWDWYSGNTQFTSQAEQQSEWIKAWDHVAKTINQNATAKSLITWVWAPNIEQGAVSVSGYWSSGGQTVSSVNMTGLDGYYVNSGTTWANRFASSVTDVNAASGSKPFMVAETGIPPGDSNATAQEADLISGAESAHAKIVFYFDSGSYVMTSAMKTAWLADVK